VSEAFKPVRLVSNDEGFFFFLKHEDTKRTKDTNRDLYSSLILFFYLIFFLVFVFSCLRV
jgi:hypothetical protein